MKLGTAVWSEGASERTAMVAELPSDPGRVVDLNRLEHLRLAKLGEGWAERLAGARVPPGLRQLLEGGPRAIHRARQVVAYAEKWHGRGGLPESLAPRADQVRMLACLPRPLAVRRWDGSVLDRLALQGPSGTPSGRLLPTLALVGLHGDRPAGCCLALEHAQGVLLGAWLELDLDWDGALECLARADAARAAARGGAAGAPAPAALRRRGSGHGHPVCLGVRDPQPAVGGHRGPSHHAIA
jgi:hypothetical protein